MKSQLVKVASCKYLKHIFKNWPQSRKYVCANFNSSTVCESALLLCKQNCSEQFYTNRTTTRDIHLSVMVYPTESKDDFLWAEADFRP